MLLAGACFLSSCSLSPMAFSPDISNHEVYKPYVAKTVYLRYQGYSLYRANGSYFEDYVITSSTLYEDNLIAKLKKGTPLYIEKVKKVRPSGLPDAVYVIGTISIKGKKYRFEKENASYANIYKYPPPFLLKSP